MNLSYICCVSYKCAHSSVHTVKVRARNSHALGLLTFFNTLTADALSLSLLAFLDACGTQPSPSYKVCTQEGFFGRWWGWSLEIRPNSCWAGAHHWPQSLSFFWDRVFKLYRLALNFLCYPEWCWPSYPPASACQDTWSTGLYHQACCTLKRLRTFDNFYQGVKKVSKSAVKELT